MFEAAVACPITDVVAHPFVLSPEVFGFSKEEFLAFGCEMMGHIDQKRLINQLDMASQRGIGIEISPKFIKYNQRHLAEFYQLCLDREVKLMVGSDAHSAEQLEELKLLENRCLWSWGFWRNTCGDRRSGSGRWQGFLTSSRGLNHKAARITLGWKFG